jgi:ubiquinone/menaquinone biosynthesis C-methylase UbiE
MFDYIEYYNKIAPIFNDIRLDREPEFNKTISIIRSNSDIGDKMLDIGCGTGVYAATLQEMGYNVFGIDKSPGQIKIAQQAIPIVLGDATSLPFGKESFDLCLMLMMLQHIKHKGRDYVFSEINRVLRKGGKLIIKTQSHDDLKLRRTSYFFPKSLKYNLLRYPDIPILTEYLSKFGNVKKLSTCTAITHTVDGILNNLKNRGTSSIAMLTSQEFNDGFRKAEKYYRQFGNYVVKDTYHTYIILQKNMD